MNALLQRFKRRTLEVMQPKLVFFSPTIADATGPYRTFNELASVGSEKRAVWKGWLTNLSFMQSVTLSLARVICYYLLDIFLAANRSAKRSTLEASKLALKGSR